MKKERYYIAVDLDGVLATPVCFPDIGEKNKAVVGALLRHAKYVREVFKKEVVFILWTCRADLPEKDSDYLTQALNWLKENIPEIHFTYVNENPEVCMGHPELVKKIHADEYWDDHNYFYPTSRR